MPYVIPMRDARRLAETWLEALDAFPQRGFTEMWTDIMYAFGLALLKLRMKVRLTHMVATNFLPYAKLQHDIVHYSNGDKAWDKRQFLHRQDIHRVWQPPFEAKEGTVVHEIFHQIKQARVFYAVISLEKLKSRRQGSKVGKGVAYENDCAQGRAKLSSDPADRDRAAHPAQQDELLSTDYWFGAVQKDAGKIMALPAWGVAA